MRNMVAEIFPVSFLFFQNFQTFLSEFQDFPINSSDLELIYLD